jgi:hypothetical protein
VQDIAYVLRLTLADHELLTVIERQQPTLASDHAHFSDLFDVHEGIPMYAAKGCMLEPFFDISQVLRSEKTPVCGQDPNELPVRLKRENLVGVEQEKFFTEFTNDFANLRTAGHNLL